MLHTVRFITVWFAALGLAPGAAHVLELPVKMRYDAQMYAAVTSSLYQLFGSVGAMIQLGSVLMAAWLTVLTRSRPSFRATLAGTTGLALSIVLWAALVAPVNAEWGRVIESAPHAVPNAYLQLRNRWEYGHVAAFAAWLMGFSILLHAAINRRLEES